MTTPTTPKKTVSGRKPARLRNKNGQFRARRKTDPQAATDARERAHLNGTSRTRSFSGGSEHLIILVAALAFGLVGLAVHVLWIVSIILMALLVGLMGVTLGANGVTV